MMSMKTKKRRQIKEAAFERTIVKQVGADT